MDPVVTAVLIVGVLPSAAIGYCFGALRSTKQPVEHKVEIAELGENDILVLTHEGLVSSDVAERLKTIADEKLSTPGRFSMVIGGGFKVSVIRRIAATPWKFRVNESPDAASTPSLGGAAFAPAKPSAAKPKPNSARKPK